MAGYPTLTYPELLENATRAELEQVLSLLQGYLSIEHKDDGVHKAITVDSVSLNLNTSASEPLRGVTAITDEGNKVRLKNTREGTCSTEVLANDTSNVTSASVLLTAASTSTVTLNADTVAITPGINERGRSTRLGEWTAVAHSAGNFTAASGNWTVDSADQTTYSYTLVGKTMTLAFVITASDVSAAAAHLRLAIPGGFTAAADMRNVIQVTDAGTVQTGLARVRSGLAYLEIFPDLSGSAWTSTSSDNTSVAGQLTFEVQ